MIFSQNNDIKDGESNTDSSTGSTDKQSGLLHYFKIAVTNRYGILADHDINMPEMDEIAQDNCSKQPENDNRSNNENKTQIHAAVLCDAYSETLPRISREARHYFERVLHTRHWSTTDRLVLINDF